MTAKLTFQNVPVRRCHLLRSIPIEPHDLVRVQRDVLLSAADIAPTGTGQFNLQLFPVVPDSDGNAGVNNGVCVKKRGKPRELPLIFWKVNAR